MLEVINATDVDIGRKEGLFGALRGSRRDTRVRTTALHLLLPSHPPTVSSGVETAWTSQGIRISDATDD